MTRPLQVVIGVDAMEWQLVRRWAGEGRLPALALLLATGTHAELASPAEDLPDTSWSSLYTGLNPAKQERYFHLQFEAATQRLRCLTDDVLRALPFWSLMSRAGRRIAVLDAPKYPLMRDAQGLQLVNWGSHATHTAPASTPAALWSEVDRSFGPFPVRACDAVGHSPRALRTLRERILAGVRAHGALFRWALHAAPCDLFFATFSAPHCAGHHFWHGLEVGHPRHREAVEHGLADTLEEVYRAVDREIAALLEEVPGDCQVFVCSPEGMGRLGHASWILQEILDDLGYGDTAAPRPVGPRRARPNPFRRLRRALPSALQFALLERLPAPLHDRLLSTLYTRGRQWRDCRAFAVPNNDGVGAIRLNVRGREVRGSIDPGREYRDLCDSIAADLLALRDSHSGRPVVARVGRPQERYHGPYADRLPDLTVTWEQNFAWGEIESARLGRVAVPHQDSRTGSHRAAGFLVAAGPGIPAQRGISGASVLDVAPTLLAAAAVPLPHGLDGRPLPLTDGDNWGTAARHAAARQCPERLF